MGLLKITDPRILGLTLVITAVSGANFFSVLMFWPTQAFNTYDQDPVHVGLRGLPIGLAIMVGCCVVLVALSVWGGHIRLLMVVSTITMTIGWSITLQPCLRLLIGTGVSLICLSTPQNEKGMFRPLFYQHPRLLAAVMYPILIIAGLGIGGILVPASVISTIVCPGTSNHRPK